MILGYEDLFVGTVTIGLGAFLIGCSAAKWQWFYSLRTARWLMRLLGANGARICHALIGLGLIALGLAVASGYRWPLIGS